MEKRFPNGFINWAETHHEIVSAVTKIMLADRLPIVLEEIQLKQGTGGIYEFCIDLADEFEELNRGREWDGEFFDEIEVFINQKINL